MTTPESQLLPVADVQETDRLELSATTLAKQNVYESMQTICDVATGAADYSRLRCDMAKYVVDRVLGPIKGPAGDWVEDFLKDVRNPAGLPVPE